MIVAALLTALAAVPVFVFSTQAELIMQDVPFTQADLGIGVGIFFTFAAVSSLVITPFADRFNPRISGCIGAFLNALSCGLVALAVTGFGVMLACLAACGIANGLLQLAGNRHLLDRRTDGLRLGVAFGVKQSATPIAVLTGGVVLSLASISGDWRTGFWIVSGLAVLGGVVLAVPRHWRQRLAVPRSEQPRDGAPQGRPSGAAQNVADNPATQQAHFASTPSARKVPSRASLAVCVIALMFAGGTTNATASFFPLWAMDSGVSGVSVGVMVSVCSALAVLMRIGFGVIGQALVRRRLIVITAQCFVGAAGLCLVALGVHWSLFAGIAMVYAIGWAWPGLILYVVSIVGRDSPGRATSAVQAGVFAGASFGPLLFGRLVEGMSYPFAWSVAAAAMIVAGVMFLLTRVMFLRDLRSLRAG